MADPITAGLVYAGMSAGTAATVVATAGTAMTYMGYASTGISLLQGLQGGQQEQYGYTAQSRGVDEQAHMSRMEAQEQGNLRRERLLNALAAQNSRAGAGGVEGGSIEALKLKSMEDYERDQGQADMMSKSKQSGFQRQRDALKIQGKTAKKNSLLDLGMGLADIGFSMGATGGSSGGSQAASNSGKVQRIF